MNATMVDFCKNTVLNESVSSASATWRMAETNIWPLFSFIICFILGLLLVLLFTGKKITPGKQTLAIVVGICTGITGLFVAIFVMMNGI